MEELAKVLGLTEDELEDLLMDCNMDIDDVWM